MARTTPLVRQQQDGFVLNLSLPSIEEATTSLHVGTPAWYHWLEQNRVFRFESADGRFSARREQRPGGWYWYASRRVQGVLRIAYLGRSQEIDAARLISIARQLATGRTPADTRAPQHPVVSAPFAPAPEIPLLLSKLAAPRPRPGLLPRPHLVARLEQCRHFKLTLLSTPAGFGKTTLLGEWSRQTILPIAWLSLDEEDNDPIRFWRYVLAALKQIQSSPGVSATPLLRLPGRSAVHSALVVLLNELTTLQQEIVLVLDDYHLVRDPEIHQSFAFLLAHLPAQIHLLLASRSGPPLPLASLRAAGELLELYVPDLRFAESEAIAFLQQTTTLSIETMKTLAARTEGWVAGLQLAIFSVRGREDGAQFIASFTGNSRHLIDYLADEVLASLPADQLDFLLRTSLLARLSASLCDTVLERNDSQRLLEQLEQSRLFLFPLDDERHWYRYHQLFAEVLRHRLSLREPELVPTLQSRAAAWYDDHQLPDEAIVYALAAQDFDHVIRLLERLAEPTLLAGESGTVQGWLDALPDQLVRSHPLLSCFYAFLLLVLSQFGAVEERLQDAERAIQQAGLSERDTATRSLLGMIAVARSTVAVNFGDAAAIWYAQQALDYLETHELALRGVALHNLGEAYEARNDIGAAMQAFRRSIESLYEVGSFFVAVTALGSLSRLQAAQGQLQQAASTCRRALHLARIQPDRESALLPSAGKILLLLGELLYEWNDLGDALQQVEQGIALSQIWMHRGHIIDGYLLLARVHQARGELEAAAEAVQTAQRLVEEARADDEGSRQLFQNRRLETLNEQVEVAQARLWIIQGKLDATRRWAETRGLDTERDQSECSPGVTSLVLVELLLAQHRPDHALKILSQLLQQAEANDWQAHRLNLLTYQTIALSAAGQASRAQASLARVLSLAEPENHVRIFLDRGASMAALLHDFVARQGAAPYVERLLKAFTLSPGSLLSSPGESLSEREHEILSLLASGLSNREVAERLVITIGTVKWYAHNIYGKLGVSSRTQAIAEARRLQLLA